MFFECESLPNGVFYCHVVICCGSHVSYCDKVVCIWNSCGIVASIWENFIGVLNSWTAFLHCSQKKGWSAGHKDTDYKKWMNANQPYLVSAHQDGF